jgi:NitT/TauT family transport system substrate-binding protein
MRRSAWTLVAVGMLLAVIAATGALMTPAGAQGTTKVSLRLKWLPQAQFAGYYVAQAKGYYAAEGLDLTINPGGPNVVAENLVASGSDTFGHGGGFESLLASRDKGLPLVGIGVLFQKTSFGFVTKKGSGITKLEDFRGKKVSTWYTGAQFILRGMLAAKGIAPGDVIEVPQGVTMTPFISGEIPVATVTWFNELQTLYEQGMKDLLLFDPSEYGVVIPREVLIVTEETVTKNPALVQKFLRASLRGWKDAITNQKEAVDILMKVQPQLNRAHQENMIREVAKLVLWGPGGARGIGVMDRGALEYTHKFLLEHKQLKAPVNLDQAINPRFWDEVPVADKKA